MAGEGAEKRKAEDGEAQEAVKRPRVDGSNGGAPAAAPAAKKLGIDLEKLQKAKAALQKQKELAEKLKKAGIAVRGAWCGGGGGACGGGMRLRERHGATAACALLMPLRARPRSAINPCPLAARIQARTSSSGAPATSSCARCSGSGEGGGSGGSTRCSSSCGAGWPTQGTQACHQAAAAPDSRRAGSGGGRKRQAD